MPNGRFTSGRALDLSEELLQARWQSPRGDHCHDDEWFFWLTLFRTGVRIGEGLALELADFRVDDAKPALHVHQTMSQGVGLHPQRKNVDDVAVHLRIWPSYLEEARRFQRHRRQQNQQRELVTPWAFSNEQGQPWAYATLHGHFGAILRAAGLPHHTPHDTRHTFAVNLLDWTHDIDYVAQMLGDSLDRGRSHIPQAPGRAGQVRAVRGDRRPEAGGG